MGLAVRAESTCWEVILEYEPTLVTTGWASNHVETVARGTLEHSQAIEDDVAQANTKTVAWEKRRPCSTLDDVKSRAGDAVKLWGNIQQPYAIFEDANGTTVRPFCSRYARPDVNGFQEIRELLVPTPDRGPGGISSEDFPS